MGEYKVYNVQSFERKLLKESKETQEQVSRVVSQLRKNPLVGDQIRYKHFREKRVGRHRRLYYLVYTDLKIVLVIEINTKKEQAATISETVTLFPEYRKYAVELSRKQ